MSAIILAIAQATHNRIFPMLVHWHMRVRVDLRELLYAVRRRGTGHLQGIAHLVGLIIAGDKPAVTRLLEQFHTWAIPTLVAAAATRNGEHA